MKVAVPSPGRALTLTRQNQNVKVLVVEDDLDLARVLTAMFERHGIKTFHAQTGQADPTSQRIFPHLVARLGTAGATALP